MNYQRTKLLAATILAVTATVATTPISGDELVLKTGEVIETKGPWQQRGPRVIYSSTNGTLLSVRANEVDFAATEKRASEQSGDPRPAESTAQAPVAQPVKVITNRDVGGAKPVRAAASLSEVEGTDEGETPTSSSSSTHELAVTEYSDLLVANGLEIQGVVTNVGNATAIQVQVNAFLRDREQVVIASAVTDVPGGPLSPGDSAPFTVVIDSIASYEAIDFKVSSIPLRRSPVADPSADPPSEPAEGTPNDSNDGQNLEGR